MHKCQRCGDMFTPKESNRKTYCSRACAFVAKTMSRETRQVYWAPGRVTVEVLDVSLPRSGRARLCRVCGQQFVRATGQSRKATCEQVCSVTCRVVVRRQKQQTLRRTPNGRAWRAAAKARRRAVHRSGESFDPHEIFVRDGWRCQRCGVQTPVQLRGSYDLTAPELDHVVPLARGGSHTRSNAQMLCRGCNIEKGARAA